MLLLLLLLWASLQLCWSKNSNRCCCTANHPAVKCMHLWWGVVWQEVRELREQVRMRPEQHRNLHVQGYQRQASRR